MHKFDAGNRHRLDNEKRRATMPPFETFERLGLRKGNAVADIGCGAGYFTIPAAEITGPHSKIYAMDISPEMLEEVEKKAMEAGLANVRGISTDEYDLKIGDEAVDFAIMSNVLHEIEDKGRIIAEINRILKKGGRLAIVEWAKIRGEYGPPPEERLSPEELEDMLSRSNFESIG
jgi:ubiquinone/menaquinone biosynthesis C-methylase UbiE